ncbi:MAG: DUF2508 family protein [Eubacteriales bacterium]|nr:DUF2508 family protein [Eubacteriales bacterium]
MKSIFRISRRPERAASPLTYEESLRTDLQLAKWELENAYAGFDYVTEPDLIDCYIYELNAAMKRYKYLLEKFSELQKGTVGDSVRTEDPLPAKAAGAIVLQPLS